MSGRGAGGQRCQLILQRCLAIHLTKPGNAPDDFWMYDSGYLLFQSFLAANAKCWWAGALAAATAELRYAGYVSPGVLLVAGAPRALEIVRGAYSRSVLKPPPTYLICGLGDIEDCIVTPAYQGQFTPLPEALCDCIMDLTSQFVAFIGLLAVAAAAPMVDPEVAARRALPALEHEEVHDEFGQYALRYVTAEGTVVSERGRLVLLPDGSDYVMVFEGEVSFIGDDGKTYITKYSAGLDGTKVEGNHLPKAPQSIVA